MNDERKFLHDLASPLTIAIGLTELAWESLAAQGEAQVELAARLKRTMVALDNARKLLEERRNVLRLRDVPPEGAG